ncbi:hypothetical protein WEH80_22320 [Actinomycetes bacterium KLBMP 9759]
MPIRSPRGRSAAYRGLWQWPLRSPVRLAVTLVVLVAVAAGVGFGVAALSGSNRSGLPPLPSAGATSTAQPPRQRTPSTPTPTALPPVRDLQPTTLPASQAPPVALDVATRWTTAWLRPPEGTPVQQWLDGLRPMTTDEYLGVLSGVDPANIPATRVTGPPRPVRVAGSSVRVEVPTDALTLLVLVVDTGSGWRVAGYDKV